MKARQKKRIKDTAALVKNVKGMHDDMHSLYIEYDLDLKDFFLSLAGTDNTKQQSEPKKTQQSETFESHDISISKENQPHDDQTEETSNSKKAPPKLKGRPPKKKIKDVYRAIMKLCHPDKMKMEELDEREYYRRKSALKICSDAYPKNDYEGLIFAAALVEIYVPGVSEKEYIENLNNLYSKYNENISRIQTSVEWAWGINWDTLESRYKIVSALCQSRGIMLPEKIKVIEKLINHETK